MNLSPQARLRSSKSSDTSMLQQQLEKEVVCLVRQLDRVRMDGSPSDRVTLKTYENMIESRRKMLHNLPVGAPYQAAVGSV